VASPPEYEGALAARAWQGLGGLVEQRVIWEELLRAARVDPLCNSFDWTLAYARAFVPEADVLGWTFSTSSGQPCALVALRREPARGRLALRRALFLADGSFDSDYLEPLVLPGAERALAAALLEQAARIPGIEALVLAGVPERSPFLAAMRAELERRGLPRREQAVACLAAPLPADFERYLAGLKPRMRTKVRSVLRSALERGARLSWCTSAPELDQRLEELFRLHGLRWRALGRPGSFEDPRRRGFYRDLAGLLLERGQLRFARLEREGRTLACQFGALVAGTYYQLQEGYDPELEEERVGTALRALALERLMGEGARSYDFMAGDSRHKRDWGGELRACTTLACALPRWRARFAYGARELVDRWRRRTLEEEGRKGLPDGLEEPGNGRPLDRP
jgi:CelD/BcsL family acetyltransferase involved in cellulose biosynthesis